MDSNGRYSVRDNLLEVVEKQEVGMRDFGFAWERLDQVINQIRDECAEVVQAHEEGDRTHLQEEVGDLMQAAIGLAVFLEMDPQITLLESVNKFQKRFDTVVKLAKEDGYSSLHGQPFDVLMSYWNRAKRS